MKKKIMAMVLAVLCLTMILLVAAFADESKITISEVTLVDDTSPVDGYKVGGDAYSLSGFLVKSTIPGTEGTTAVNAQGNAFVENGTDWKHCTVTTEIEAGKQYMLKFPPLLKIQ